MTQTFKTSPAWKAHVEDPVWKEKQRKAHLGKPTKKRGWSTPEKIEKLSLAVKQVYEKNPEERYKKTKNANKEIRENGWKRHDIAVEEEMKKMEKQGFQCINLDKPPRPDFLAKKDGKVLAVEVEFGTLRKYKYKGVTFYDEIIWIKKGKYQMEECE
jgi:hypothetical protein